MDQTSGNTTATGKVTFRLRSKRQISVCCLLLMPALPTFAQSLRGNVFDLTTGEPIPNVIVANSVSGNQSHTGASGTYSMPAQPGDTIWFRMLGYVAQNIQIPPHPVKTIMRNVYLSKNYFAIPEVEIYPDISSYQKDSAEERAIFGKKVTQKQAKFGIDKFKYMKGALTFSSPISAPIEHFSPKYKRLRAFQKRFKQNEQRGFVETRYTLELIRRVTGLKKDSLIAFRNQNPLPFELALHGTDMAVMIWIKEQFKAWIRSPYVPELTDSAFRDTRPIPRQ